MTRIKNVNIKGTQYDIGNVASISELGVIKVGSGLSIAEDGTLSSSGGGAVLYPSTGQNTDGAMTQKATTDILATKADTSANVSTFTNDAGYQTSAQVSAAITSAVSGITSFEYQVVQELPATGEKGVVYLLSNSGTAPNIYDEYIWMPNGQSGSYEKIGTTEVDLSNYVEFSDLATVATTGSYSDLSNKPTIPTVSQTTGQSTTDVMSQKAITDIVGNIESALSIINNGTGA